MEVFWIEIEVFKTSVALENTNWEKERSGIADQERKHTDLPRITMGLCAHKAIVSWKY